jgi:hypothetical protein
MKKAAYLLGLIVLLCSAGSCNGIYEMEVASQEQIYVINKYTGEIQMIAVGNRVVKWDLEKGEKEIIEWK